MDKDRLDLIDKAHAIVKGMYDHDPFSRWLGIRVLDVLPGSCALEMTVRDDMLNGHGTAHGGITYSLADSALAFASNGHGQRAVSVETSISHIKPVRSGDRLLARAEEQYVGHRIGLYQIRIINQNEELVAVFRGHVYRSSKTWDEKK